MEEFLRRGSLLGRRDFDDCCGTDGYKPELTAEHIRELDEIQPCGDSLPPISESAAAIARECDRIKAVLVEKNAAYGNSALDPVRVFSTASTVEQLLVRIDDKLSRVRRGTEFGGDDTVLDLIGYLILLRVAQGAAS